MDFELSDDNKMIRDVVQRFVKNELLPLEPMILRREAAIAGTAQPLVPPEVEADLQEKAKALGLWGIDLPEEFGGQDLGALTKLTVIEQLRYSVVPLTLAPDSPNLHFLKSCCKGEQIERYLIPYGKGEKKSCLALTEPGAGSDIGGMSTRAERRNGKWILNGEKIFISHLMSADFMIVIAVTDPDKRQRGGMTAFLVDKNTPGVTIPSSYPTIAGEYLTFGIHFDNVELGDEQVLGEVGDAFIPLQNRLGIRRMEIAAKALGAARRCLDIMLEHANNRSTFGQKLAERQAVQWWIADSHQEMEMCRLLAYRLAWRIDSGEKDVRREASMVKLQASEMIGRVADRAVQLLGGMGLSKESPIEYIYRAYRVQRIVEGASEIHRWTIARDLLRNGQPVL
ncbi:acyl-CoA dehydrogenase family protein [Devosia sp. Root635]|uniref:acyl-CoA dehydrogenase family protein n=1 Tax=Devosia sp. Root635 TaxID=1736575 RepID=UPI0006F93F11|nr:acyl-CoA dehydrogenase [Devosia sp. Root635]KRA44983.1 benzylsuccinyl-CoA dehydrogenase [Devosia sp. Root635]